MNVEYLMILFNPEHVPSLFFFWGGAGSQRKGGTDQDQSAGTYLGQVAQGLSNGDETWQLIPVRSTGENSQISERIHWMAPKMNG